MSIDFIKQFVKYIPSKLIPALTGFITLPIITRLFPPEEYGEYVLAEGLAIFLVAATCSGFNSGALRFYSEYKKKFKLGSYFLALNFNLILVTSLTALLGFAILIMTKNTFSSSLYDLLKIGILLFVCQSFSGVYLDIIRAKEMAGTYSTITLLKRYLALGIGLILVLIFHFSIEGLLFGELFGYLLLIPIMIFISIKGANIKVSDFSLKESTIFLKWAWPLLLGNMAMWSLNLSDRYMIGYFLSEKEIGLYSIGSQISAKTIALIVSLFILGMEPMIVNTWVKKGMLETKKSFNILIRTYLIFCVPACVGVALLAEPIMKLLTTRAYYDGYRIIGYIAFSTFFWGLSMVSIMGLVIGKKTKTIAFNQFIVAIINFGLNMLLIPRFGFVAAGFTTLLGFTILFMLTTYQARKIIRWDFPFRTLVNVIVSSLLMSLALTAMREYIKSNLYHQIFFLIISIITCGSIYFISLFILRELGKKELIAIRNTRE